MSKTQILSFRGRGLEETIFLRTVLVAFITMVLMTINAIIHGFCFPLGVFDFSASVILLGFFLIAKYYRNHANMVLPFIGTMIVLIDLSWFMSGGYKGPVAYFMILLVMVGIIISRKEIQVFLLTLLLINTLALYTIELLYPEIITVIPPEKDIYGQAIILILSMVIAAIVIIQLKDHYTADRKKIIAMNDQLSGQTDEIRQSKIEIENYSERLKREVENQTKQLENLNKDLQDQNASHEQFTYILAHNMRSPISQLKGLFNILPDDFVKNKVAKETLDRMEGSIMKLDNVIHDLSKIINLKKDSKDLFEKVYIKRQLDLALNTLGEQIQKSSAKIDVSDVDNVTIKGIRAYIQSILYNLIHNALKYADDSRRPRIKISACLSNGKVEIKVSDNGIGIDLIQTKGRLFQLYQRFNADKPGKGFGLFLIKTQVEAMGGEIDVESKVGIGTTFTIRL